MHRIAQEEMEKVRPSYIYEHKNEIKRGLTQAFITRMEDEYGVLGFTYLSRLPTFNLVRDVVVDAMHTVVQYLKGHLFPLLSGRGSRQIDEDDDPTSQRCVLPTSPTYSDI